MSYFIDHKHKLIHRKLFAKDRCGFIGTPVDLREFTNSLEYISELQEEKHYSKCPHCQGMKPAVKDLFID